MEPWAEVIERILTWIPSVVILTVGLGVILIARFFLFRKTRGEADFGLIRQLLMFALVSALVVALVMALPIGESARGQLMSLLGLLITAAVALSSATFVGNAMAGLMLRSLQNFTLGDFLKVGSHIGRVSERGLLHTEIQTEDRDLTTFPNLYLVTNPVTVVRTSGTIVSATVSLGYDAPRKQVEMLLLEAAGKAGLSDAFVQIPELGDFSVTYRIAGFWNEVKYLLSARSKLRACMLDALHEGGIEIVSPTFMNQRVFSTAASFIPHAEGPRDPQRGKEEKTPENLIFDKADEAETKAELKKKATELEKRIADLSQIKEKDSDPDRERQKQRLKHELEQVQAVLGQPEPDGD